MNTLESLKQDLKTARLVLVFLACASIATFLLNINDSFWFSLGYISVVAVFIIKFYIDTKKAIAWYEKGRQEIARKEDEKCYKY